MLAATSTLTPGTFVCPIASNLDRHGAVVVGAEDADAADTRAAQLLDTLRIDMCAMRRR